VTDAAEPGREPWLIDPGTRVTCPKCGHEFSLEEGFAKKSLEALEESSHGALSALQAQARSAEEKRARERIAQAEALLNEQLKDMRALIDAQRRKHTEALEQMRKADVLITMWGARPIPPALAHDPGRVRYILNLTGTCRPYIPIEVIRGRIAVTNWGDAPARAVAEGAMALLGFLTERMRYISGLQAWLALILGAVILNADYVRLKLGDNEASVGSKGAEE
jgi:hypothetical protein